jgi:hypothetical protein
MQLNVARDERSDELGISCCAGAATPDGLADIVYLYMLNRLSVT